MVPILGAAVIACGVVYSVFFQKQQIPASGACLAGGIFFGYLAIVYWYWNLIRLGKWRKIWRYMMHFVCSKVTFVETSGSVKPATKINMLMLAGYVSLMFSVFARLRLSR
jgi:hypothetical protein